MANEATRQQQAAAAFGLTVLGALLLLVGVWWVAGLGWAMIAAGAFCVLGGLLSMQASVGTQIRIHNEELFKQMREGDEARRKQLKENQKQYHGAEWK